MRVEGAVLVGGKPVSALDYNGRDTTLCDGHGRWLASTVVDGCRHFIGAGGQPKECAAYGYSLSPPDPGRDTGERNFSRH
jgi:hypothetical protein